jgi:hypothetical protein
LREAESLNKVNVSNVAQLAVSWHLYYTTTHCTCDFFFFEDVYPEHLDDRGSAEDLGEAKPHKHLPHGALGDRSVVELGEVARVHRLRAGELENVLQNKINIFF